MMSPNRGSINRTNQRKDHFSQTSIRRTMISNSTASLLGKRVEQCQIRRISARRKAVGSAINYTAWMLRQASTRMEVG